MKAKTVFLLFFCAFSVFLNAQNDKDIILQDTKTIVQATLDKDYDKILDLTHPEAFNVVSRDMMKTSFTSLLEGNEEMKIELLKTQDLVINVSDINKTSDNTSYAFAAYPLEMKMIMSGAGFEKDQQEMMKNIFAMQGFEAEFLSENTVKLKKRSVSVAIKNKQTENKWRYLNCDETNYLYNSLIPEEIRTKAKEFQQDLKNKK